MNMTARNEKKSEDLRDAIKSLGGWPLLGSPSSVSLTQLLGNSRREFGHEVFLSLYVYADAKDTQHNVLYIDQGSLALGRGSRDYYLNETLFAPQIQAYMAFVRDVVSLLHKDEGSQRQPDDIAKEIQNLLVLERAMAKV